MTLQHVVKVQGVLCEIKTVNNDGSLYCKNLRWNDKLLVNHKRNLFVYRDEAGKMRSAAIKANAN